MAAPTASGRDDTGHINDGRVRETRLLRNSNEESSLISARPAADLVSVVAAVTEARAAVWPRDDGVADDISLEEPPQPIEPDIVAETLPEPPPTNAGPLPYESPSSGPASLSLDIDDLGQDAFRAWAEDFAALADGNEAHAPIGGSAPSVRADDSRMRASDPVFHAETSNADAIPGSGGAETHTFGARVGGDPVFEEATPTSPGVVTTHGLSGNGDHIDSLLYGAKWGTGGVGTGVSLTYSFGGPGSTYKFLYGNGEPNNGLAEFTADQKVAAQLALESWSGLANVTFTEVTDSASVAGDIRFALSNAPSTAWAYLPGAHTESGDVWVSQNTIYQNPIAGNYAYMTFVHEIGHALGLTHTHSTLGISTVAPLAIDTTRFSVMSYRSYEGAPFTGYTQNFYPTGPMLHDVAAVQYLYGANAATNAGDTVYGWAPGQRILETIWDAGGTDTIDWSNQSAGALIDLDEGAWSELGPAYDTGPGLEFRTLAIAYGATIENAFGGSGNDTIFGNSVANDLQGAAGNDTLSGGSGSDTLAGGAGADSLLGGAGDDELLIDANDTFVDGGSGIDTVIVEGASGVSLDLAAANIEVAYGGSGNDWFDASASAVDTRQKGGAGNDTLIGGAGGDVLQGDGSTKGLSFDGTGTVLIAAVTGFPSSAMTLEVTFSTTDVARTGTVFSYAVPGQQNEIVLYNTDSLQVYIGGLQVSTGLSFTDGAVHRLTVTWDSATGGVAVFDNGVLGYAGTLRQGYAVSDGGTLTLGQEQDSVGGGFDPTQAFVGKMVQATIWNRALDAGEVAGAGPADGLVADFALAEGAGVETNDLTGGWTGQLLGGVTWSGGDDLLIGGTGADTLIGGAGNDTLIVDAADTAIDGGVGFDRVVVEGAAGVTLNLAASGIEVAIGNSGPDLFDASVATGATRQLGRGGADTLIGGRGADTLIGGAGDDVLRGDGSAGLLFDGSGAVLVAGMTAFPATALTVEVMFTTGDTTRSGTLFSYAVAGSDNEFVLFDTDSLSLFIGGQWIGTGLSFTDDASHRLTVTWDSTGGAVAVYDNGVLRFEGVLNAGHAIGAGGTLALGQEQDAVGGGFDPGQAFEGEIEHVTIWSRVLDAGEVAGPSPTDSLAADFAFAEGDGSETVDATGLWTGQLQGGVGWVGGDDLLVGGYGADTLIGGAGDDVLRGDGSAGLRFDGSGVVLVPGLTAFPALALTVEAVFTTSDATRSGTIFSYAVAGSDNEFVLFDTDSLSIYIGGQGIGTGLSFTDGSSHRLTVSWDSASGAVAVYDNGVLRFEGVLNPGHAIGAGGTLALGQEQDAVGGGFDPNQAFQGGMEQVTIWSRVLDAGEVAGAGPTDSLVADFTLAEGAGMETIDATGLWTGQLAGGVDWLGDDLLVGGGDLLTGGDGHDRFVITTLNGGDRITDFSAAEDILDLSELITGYGGDPNEAAAFLRLEESAGGDTTVLVNPTGDPLGVYSAAVVLEGTTDLVGQLTELVADETILV